MAVQLLIGSVLILATVMLTALSWWLLEVPLERFRRWAVRTPRRSRIAVVLSAVLIYTLAVMTMSVWLWALAFEALGLFGTLEEAVYFALVSFTTLGFGDILLPKDWRLLGGMAAANGFLSFSLLTAILVETFRVMRRARRGEHFD